MKTLLLASACAAVLLTPTNLNSQVANYVFSETTGTYQAIITNVAVGSWSGTISSSSSNNILISTPFEFCLGGVTYPANSDLTMHHDGWAVFGNPSTTQATRTAPLTNFNNVMSIFGTDLITTGTSSYGARVIGTSPNRVLVMQWGQLYFGDAGQSPFITTNYWKRAVNGHSNDRLHFQIRLYETTNVIEFHYLISNPRTTSNGSLTSDVQVGLRGATASDFNVRRKSSTGSVWNNNSTAGVALPNGTNNTMNFNNVRNDPNNKPVFVIPASPGNGSTTAGPGTGTIFRWSPAALAPSDPLASGCYFSPLPVQLTEFTGENIGKHNLLSWTTASEQNSDYFFIERSLNGADWSLVGRVPGSGNSEHNIHYEMEDRAFSATINYYRLTQVDKDGKSSVYNMIRVDNRDSKSMLLKTVNIMGQEVDTFYKGMVIEIYSDGTSQKVYR